MIHTDWPPDRVKRALYAKGITLAALSLRAGFARNAGSIALHRRPWPVVKRLIAEAIGVPAQEIWPSIFEEDGEIRLNLFGSPRGLRRNVSTEREGGNVRSRRVA